MLCVALLLFGVVCFALFGLSLLSLLFVVCYGLLCVVFAVVCSLLYSVCPVLLCIVYGLLRWPLFSCYVCRVLFVGCCLVFVVCCSSLFVACCLLRVFCYCLLFAVC